MPRRCRKRGIGSKRESSTFPLFIVYAATTSNYKQVLDAILKHNPSLRKNHSKVFAAGTINMGPQTVTEPHFDCMNLAFGLCAIFVFGTFNGKTGGHLVIRELGIVIEVHAGSIVFLPSAIVEHYNIEIVDGETRYSLTLYSAGSLFRWVYNGFRTNTELETYPMSARMRKEMEENVQ